MDRKRASRARARKEKERGKNPLRNYRFQPLANYLSCLPKCTTNPRPPTICSNFRKREEEKHLNLRSSFFLQPSSLPPTPPLSRPIPVSSSGSHRTREEHDSKKRRKRKRRRLEKPWADTLPPSHSALYTNTRTLIRSRPGNSAG